MFLQVPTGRPLLRSWFFILTLLTAIVAWVIALAGQSIASAQISKTTIPTLPAAGATPISSAAPTSSGSPTSSAAPTATVTLLPGIIIPPGFTLLALPSFFPVTSTPGTLWFAMVAQLLLLFQLFSALVSNTLPAHTPLLTAFASIVIVLAAIGVDDNIYSPATSQKLTAFGWLATAIVDCIWLLCLTAGEGTRTRRVFDWLIGGGGLSGSRAGLEATSPSQSKFTNPFKNISGPRLRRKQRKISDGRAKGTTSNVATPRDAFLAVSGNSPPPTPPSEGARTSRALRVSTIPSGVASAGENETRASSLTQSDANGDSHAQGDPEKDSGTVESDLEKLVEGFKAQALYTYTGAPDDPNELSFKKGEVLEILDKTGKWWEARRADGTEGVVPSNYMKVL